MKFLTFKKIKITSQRERVLPINSPAQNPHTLPHSRSLRRHNSHRSGTLYTSLAHCALPEGIIKEYWNLIGCQRSGDRTTGL